jgi:hypothetical protein
MRTEELIADLASRAAPFTPLPAPRVRVLGWCAVAAASAGAAMAFYGARPDLAVAFTEPFFTWTAAIAVGTGVLAAATSLVLAVPGAEGSRALRHATLAVVAVWALTLAIAIVRAGHGFAQVADWPVCFARVTAIGLPPAVALFVMLRRAAPLRPAWTSALATAAGMAIGAIAIQLICPQNDPAHALLGHFGPVATLGGLGAAMAGRLLRRSTR